MGSVTSNAKALWREASADDASDFAAGLAYRFFLALFPFLIFMTALGGFLAKVVGIDNPALEVVNRFGDALPGDARSVIESQLDGVLGAQHPGLLSVGLIGALWAASGGVGALMKAMNRMYDVEESRPFWRRTLIALGLTLFGGALFITAFVLAVAGRAIAMAVADSVGLGDLAQAGMTAAGYILAVVLLLVMVAFLYWAAPNAKLPFRWISAGSVLFTVCWLAATVLFGLYVSRFSSYNATYGALGGVVILLVWFYLTSYILLLGAELNAMLTEKEDPEEAEVPAPEPGRRSGHQSPSNVHAISRHREVPMPQTKGRNQASRVQQTVGALIAAVAVWRALRSTQAQLIKRAKQ
jgi:membrane protein